MSDPTENGERLAAFGRWLARERELRGMGRDEVTRAVKLAPGVVEALESGQEERMPPRAYAVGYLKAYAAAVGLDSDDVVLRFEEASGPAAVPGQRRQAGASGPAAVPGQRRQAGASGPAAVPGRRRQAGAPLRAVVAILAAAAVAAAGAWALLR